MIRYFRLLQPRLVLLANDPGVILIVILVIVLLGGFLALLVCLSRRYEMLAQNAMQLRFRGLDCRIVPVPGDVTITFPVYHGLLVWFKETVVTLSLPPGQAQLLLGRLLRFNLTWSLPSGGFIFILPLSLLNYWTQRRSVTRQQTAATASRSSAYQQDANPFAPPLSSDGKPPQSLFRFVVGLFCAGLATVFAVSMTIMIFNGQFAEAAGSGVIALLLARGARDWFSNRISG